MRYIGGDIITQGVDIMAFNKTEYVTSYKRKNLERIPIEVPKGKRKILKETASKYSLSVNQLVLGAVEEKYGIDLTTKENQ